MKKEKKNIRLNVNKNTKKHRYTSKIKIKQIYKTIKEKVEKYFEGISQKLPPRMKERIISYILSATLLISAGAVIIDVFEFEKDPYAIVEVIDFDDDDYRGGAPMSTIEGEQWVVPRGTMGIVEGDVKSGDELNVVKLVDAMGNYTEGKIPGKYLKELERISEKESEKYDTVYVVNAPNDAWYENGEKTIELKGKNGKKTLATIHDGEYVLGIRPEESDEEWVSVIYINEEGVKKEGKIPTEYLCEVGKIQDQDRIEDQEKTEEISSFKMIVNSDADGLNVRKGKGANTESIGIIPNGTEIEILTQDYIDGETDNNGNNWVRIILEDGSEGYVASQYLELGENVDGMKISFKVDTSRDGGVPLNLREGPSINSNGIATIPNGETVEVSMIDFASQTGDGYGRSWVKVSLVDGNEGYVSRKFLTQGKIIGSHEKVPEKVFQEEKMLGIDSIELSGEQLEEVLKTTVVSDTIDGYSEGKKIDFVFIKIGASGYGAEHREASDPAYYLEQILTCEKLGVPYGFYYYSTCTDEAEANTEYERINGILEDIDVYLEENGIENPRYNMLPFAIDVETVGENDRQDARNPVTNPSGLSRGDFVRQVTSSKVRLSKLIAKRISGRPIIYTANRAVRGGEKIFDMEKFSEEVGYEAGVWFAAPNQPSTGKPSPANQEGINSMPQGSVRIVQSHLDEPIVVSGGKGAGVDVNKMDDGTYQKFLGNQDGTTQSDDDDWLLG